MLRKAALVMFSFFTLIAASAAASTIDLPRTGQTKCYDTAGLEIACFGTGQDGDVRAGVALPATRFTDNGDLTITDGLTGVMWTADADSPGPDACVLNEDGDHVEFRTWTEAMDYVACLNANSYLGYTDWRLPNINQLGSLADLGRADTAAGLNGLGFSNVLTDFYWSSTTVAAATGYAWAVSMYDGYIEAGDKTEGRYVWPMRVGACGGGSSTVCLPRTGQTSTYKSGDDGLVKGGTAWPSPRFTDMGDGTVSDGLTGLRWTKDANTPGAEACDNGTEKNLQAAYAYIECLNNSGYLGRTDWRLPNRKELQSLIDYSTYSPALQSGHPFTAVRDWYWTSDSYSAYPTYAWVSDMSSGYVDWSYRTNVFNVWPVFSGLLNNVVLTVSRSGTGSGTVTPASGDNITWSGVTGKAYYDKGSSVLLTASADTGMVFSGWSGCDTASGDTCTMSMSAAKSVTAAFDIASYALAVTKSGNGLGSVSVSTGGLSWSGNTGTATYNVGTLVTLSASPDSGSSFGGWSGGGCSGVGDCSVTINAATDVTARFNPNPYSLVVTKTGTGSGEVTAVAGAFVWNGNTGVIDFSSVTLTAAASAGSVFSGWSGDCSGSLGTCVVTLNASRAVTATFSAAPSGSGKATGDFDGDGKTDTAVWRPSSGVWYSIGSSNGVKTASETWGLPTDTPVPGDYDGDGKTDQAVWRPSDGMWYIIYSSSGQKVSSGPWGDPTDVPVPGDYDGDGKTDPAVLRPSTGMWYIVSSSNGLKTGQSGALGGEWGVSSDVPVPGDYDGDGKTDLAVWRPSAGMWYIVNSSNGLRTGQSGALGGALGLSSDTPVPGDYDGDGKTDLAVWTPSTGVWQVKRSSDGSTTSSESWGVSTDKAVPYQRWTAR